ncbi:MAG TPA: ATP-binding protein [Kofleriaceae bacterium]
MAALSARILGGFTALLRTLSGRIILGFTVLTLTFAGVTTNIVVNQRRLESWVELVNSGYLPLSQLSKELARRCEDLKTYVNEALEKEPNTDTARIKLDALRQRRGKDLVSLEKFFTTLDIEFDRDHRLREAVGRIRMLVDAQKAHYDHVELALRRGEPFTSSAVQEGLAPLRDGERQISSQVSQLAGDVSTSVETKLKQLQDREQQARRITITLGAIAVLLGLLVTAWVVLTLRPLRRLREAARRVAAGEYGSRIEESGPAEVVELAREFNSMGRAVEERERELVRSERLAAVGKMAAMITHEVRNPLSSIGLNTELLQDELEGSSDEAKKLLRAIHREVDRLTAITEEYLAFARLPKPKIAPEAVNPLVGALAAFVREDLASKNVKLVVDLVEGDPIALIDAAQMRQCLINLVRNASEALAGKPSGTVVLRTRRAGDRIRIDVEDDGAGIAADVLPRMFDPFFSTKEGGSGLGLALTQQIVKDHGGDLAVQSTVGRGTTFTVSVPAKPA